MAVVIPQDYAQATLNFRHDDASRDSSVVLGLSAVGATAAEVFETVETAWFTELAPQTDTNTRLASVGVRIGPSTGPFPGLSVEFPSGAAGTDSGSYCPPNVGLLVRKFSVFGGRANRGRNYWPAMLETTDVDELGVIASLTVTALQTAFTDFFGLLASGNGGGTALCPAVILHDEDSPADEPVLVSAVSVDGLVATQRRRLRS